MYVPNSVIRFLSGAMEKGDDKRLAQQSPLPGIAKAADIAYIGSGHPFHLLDIYYPEGTDKPLPVIVDIHGGGLFYGDKELNRYYGMYLASLGFSVVMPSYRLVPEVLYTDQIQDIMAVYNWVAANIHNYYGDAGNLFVTGDSAGAQLAAHSALVHAEPYLQKLFKTGSSPLNIRALGLVSGMFVTQSGIIGLLRGNFYGKGYKNTELYKNMNYAIIPGLEKLPPCYLATSAQDALRDSTLEFDRILTDRGVEHILHDWPKQEDNPLAHVFSIANPLWKESRQTSGEMTDFFMKHGAGQTVNPPVNA